MKFIFALMIALLTLLMAACSDSSSSDVPPYFSENIKPFVTIENGQMKDSVIYLVNESSGIGDTLDQYSYYDDMMGTVDSELVYQAEARSMAIQVLLRFQPSGDGKRIILGCKAHTRGTIYFDDGDFPLVERGYKLDLIDSLEVGKTVYRNVLVFDGTKADTNYCDMARFYYAAEDGIVKVESKNGAVMTRTPKESKTSGEESSSSEASEEKSSSSESAESSSGETPASSSSNEEVESSSSSEIPESSSAEPPSSSSEPEPRKMANIEVLSYQYVLTDMDFLNLTIVNNEDRELDSLRLMLVFTAKPEEVDIQPTQNSSIESCPILVDHDICFAYDSEGYSNPCETDREVRTLLRHSLPVRIDNSYDSTEGTYKYLIAVPLGSTKIAAHARLRLDVGFSSGISNDGGNSCETMRQPAKKRFSKESDDWSWMPHTKAEDGADYAGMPLEDKDYGDGQVKVPVNPYIAVYRNDEYLWGYTPF